MRKGGPGRLLGGGPLRRPLAYLAEQVGQIAVSKAEDGAEDILDGRLEPSTREGYTYQIGKHIMPWFGRMKMVEILPSHVREWVTDLRQRRVSPKTIRGRSRV